MRPCTAVAAGLILVALAVLGTGCATDSGGEDRGDAGRGPRGRAGAGRQMARRDQQQPQTVWKQYDLNGDGKITPREFMAVRAICFAKYDANSDGLLTRPEVKKFFSSPLGDRIDAAFSQADLDKDGMISREEFDRESDRLFRQLDANGDLVIAGSELNNMTPAVLGVLCTATPDRPSGSPGRPSPEW
jgi:Ca2+-binding EF-hand superfamily protein